MTDREKAIVMAHTGICMLEGERLGVFYQYLNELYGRPVYTHEWLTLDIKEKSKPDFLKLCKGEESSAEHFDERIDSISRQAAIYAECEVCQIAPKRERGHNCIYYINGCKEIECLRALPSAERRGRWVDVEPAPHSLFYATCSVCGDRQTIEVANFCPMCGASMDEVEE